MSILANNRFSGRNFALPTDPDVPARLFLDRKYFAVAGA